MSKVFYQFPRTDAFSDTVIYNRIYMIMDLDGVRYGTVDNPINYIYARESSRGSEWVYATPDGTDKTPRFMIGYFKNPSWSDQNGQAVFGVDSDSEMANILGDNYIIPTSVISGKRKFNDAITQLLVTSFNLEVQADKSFSVLVNFKLNNIVYVGIRFFYSSWTQTDATPDNVVLYGYDGSISTYTLQEFSSAFRTVEIDFGEANQEVPQPFVDWLYSQSEVIYPYTYTVRSNDGQTKLAEINEAPPMINAYLTFVGNIKTLTLTGVNDREYTLQWESNTPEGKILRGLSDGIASSSVLIPVNATTAVTLTESTVLYESYGTYRPANSFDVELYNSDAEVNRVDKTDYLTSYGTMSGTLREESSMIRPTITFQSSSVPGFNYVYIPAFRRYYYVNNIVSVNKNLWRMELNCDVLMTYKDEIADVRLALARQEYNNNPYLVDSEFPLRVGNYYEIVTLESTAFDTTSDTEGYNYVLTVIGA